jgi:hypothetical protein
LGFARDAFARLEEDGAQGLEFVGGASGEPPGDTHLASLIAHLDHCELGKALLGCSNQVLS